MSVQQSVDIAPPSRTFSWGRWLRTFGTLFGFLVIVCVFWWLVPNGTFMTVNNWLNITGQIAVLGVVAFTMTIVMSIGDFDLSVGTMASLAGIIVGTLLEQDNPIGLAIAVALGVGALGGLLNGFLVAYVGISAFVATLGTLTIFGGLALYISDGSTIFGRVMQDAFNGFGNGRILVATIGEQAIRIPNLTLVMFAVLLIVWVVLEQTVFGRRLYAIGGNMEASRLAGVKVRLLRLLAFVISGFGAAVAGLLLTSRLESANATQGDGLMLDAIAAVFLGMTMSEEGEPHVLGTLVGVFILGVLANGLQQLRIDSYIQQMMTGGIIILAVTLSSLSRRSS